MPVGRGVTCTALSAINSIKSFTWTWRLGDTGLFWSRGSQNQEARAWQMTYQVGTVAGDEGSFIKAAFAQWAVGPSCNRWYFTPHIIHIRTSSLSPFPPPVPHSAILSHQPFPFSSFEKHSLCPPLESYPGTFSSRNRVQVGTPFPFGTAFSLGLPPRSIATLPIHQQRFSRRYPIRDLHPYSLLYAHN